MRLFAILTLSFTCVASHAQDQTGQKSPADPSAATEIVQELIDGGKTPSPVTPPLVDSIEEELKREDEKVIFHIETSPQPEMPRHIKNLSVVEIVPVDEPVSAAVTSAVAPVNFEPEPEPQTQQVDPSPTVSESHSTSTQSSSTESSSASTTEHESSTLLASAQPKPFKNFFKPAGTKKKSTPLFKSKSGKPGPFKKLFQKRTRVSVAK